jgi:hypothetical protein
MQRATTLALTVLAVGLLAAPAHAGGTVIAQGTILAFFPEDGDIGGVSENVWAATGSHAADGLDGAVVALPASAADQHIQVFGTPPDPNVPYDLDLFFYDGAGQYMGISCATGAPDEACTVPLGAGFVAIDAFLGADVQYQLVLG